MNNRSPAHLSSSEGIADVEGIREHVERVLSSAPFRSSERIRQFLAYVVDEALAGRGSDIKAYSIAHDCFQREPDFDPQIDPYVRIVARRLRRALKHYYEGDGAGDEIVISVPRGSYVPEFSVSDRKAAVAGVESRAIKKGRTGAVRPLSSRGATLAVVRIEAHGDAEYHEFLASGLTQEIIRALSRFSELVVVGPITVVTQQLRDSSPRDIGREHDADFVLMGAVQQLGDELRISVSLSEVASSRIIWAERFERDLTVEGLFEVQDRIASTVAATVGDASGIIVRRAAERTHGREPASLTSYEAILRGYHWNNVATTDALEEAHAALEHVVQIDPGYALAKALLSDVYFVDWSAGADSFPGALDRAETLAREAVDIDDCCSDARWALAQVHFGRRRFEEFRNEFDAALELNPNYALHLASYSLFLVGLEEWEEAEELLAAARRLNPQAPAWYRLVPIMILARRGDWGAALESAQQFKAAGFFWGPAMCGMALGHLGRREESAECVEELLHVKPRFAREGRGLIGRLLYSEGNVGAVVDGLAKAGLVVD